MGVTKSYVNRAKNSQQVKTLDAEHMNRMKKYDERRAAGDTLRGQLAELRRNIAALEAGGRAKLSDAELDELLNMRDAAADMEAKLRDIDEHTDEINYFTDTAAILFKYYDILEKGTAASPSAPAAGESPESASTATPPAGANSILKWFQAPAAAKSANAPNEADSSSSTGAAAAAAAAALNSGGTAKPAAANDRATLLDKYLACTDVMHIRASALNAKDDPAICPHCKEANRTSMVHDGYLFCNACYTVEYILVDHDKPSYKDPPKEITYFAYKRINHFNEWLNTVQGKETTLIPDEMFDKILLELKKLRIVNLSELSYPRMKDILKKLRPEGGSRYYEHIPHIITKLNGLPTPHFPPELEERLRHMFCQIQVPFLKHACALNPSRKNFLSYSYVLNKFMQLLDKDEYLSSFPLLDHSLSRETLGARVQEAMPALVPVARAA